MRKHWQTNSTYLTTLQHAQENLARARARCQCNCRCRRRPGRLVTCDWCGKQVGPGCCLAYEDPMRSFCHWCKPGLVNGVWLVYSHCVDWYACKQWCGGKKNENSIQHTRSLAWPRDLRKAQHTDTDSSPKIVGSPKRAGRELCNKLGHKNCSVNAINDDVRIFREFCISTCSAVRTDII